MTADMTMREMEVPAGGRAAAGAGKYLSFLLSGEEYALPVTKVREIVATFAITPVPQMPPHVRGVVNVRGKVIPAIDLRLKFGFPAQEYTGRTCMVIVEVTRGSGPILIGLVVDRVSEVLTIGAAEIEPLPEVRGHVDTGFMCGFAKAKGRTGATILLDLDDVTGPAGVTDVSRGAPR